MDDKVTILTKVQQLYEEICYINSKAQPFIFHLTVNSLSLVCIEFDLFHAYLKRAHSQLYLDTTFVQIGVHQVYFKAFFRNMSNTQIFIIIFTYF